MRVPIALLSFILILLSSCNKVDYTLSSSPASTIDNPVISINLSTVEDLYIVTITIHNQSDKPITLNFTDFQMQDGKQVVSKPLYPKIVLTRYKEKIAQASKQSEYYAKKKTKIEREAIFVTDNIYTPQSTDSSILEGYNTGLVTQYNNDIEFLNSYSLTNSLISTGEKKEKAVYFSKLPTDTLPITIYYKEMPFVFTKE